MSVTTRVNNVITEVRSFTYDSNGNQLQVTRTPYSEGTAGTPVVESINEYNVLNQLIRTTVGDTVVENAYNGEGYRVSKTVNGQETRYLYEYDKVVLEVDASGNQIARNIYGINLLSRTVDGQTLYYMYNGHADVTALITANNTIVATYYYDAFGNILEQTGDVNNPIRYAGYQWDAETGLYYLNARMYDPVTARFLQEDSYRGNPNDPLSLNLYTYVHNEPIMYYDPSGHWRVLNNLWEGTKNVASKTAEWTKVQKDYFVEGLDILTDSTKRREAFELIDTYGSESDKIMSRVYAGTAVVAGTGIVAATAVYSAPLLATGAMKVAAASPLAGYAMMKGDKLLYGTLGVVGGGASLVDNIKNEEYGKAVLDLAMIGLGAYTLGSVVSEYNATNAYINNIGNNTQVAQNNKLKPNLQLFADKNSSTVTKSTLDYTKEIQIKNDKFYAQKNVIDEIGKIEARGVDFSQLKSNIISSRTSTEGGVSQVVRYSDNIGVKYIVHEVTDIVGKLLHRDFDAVRISSGQLINKLMK